MRTMKLQKQTRSRASTLLYGFHTVAAAWLNTQRECYSLRVTRCALESLQDTFEQARGLRLKRPVATITSGATLDALVPGAVHQGMVLEVRAFAEPDWKEFTRQPAKGDVIVLDQITDPHNIGAILRSAVIFGCRAVIILRRHMPVITGVVAKSASGALEHITLFRVANVSCSLEQLRTVGYTCVGLDQRAQQILPSLSFSTALVFVFGAEGKGLRRLTLERCDVLTKIPTYGKMNTLNVSNAVAITLYERMSRGLTG